MASSILDPYKDVIISQFQDNNMKMSNIVKQLQMDFGIAISYCTIQTRCKVWGIIRQPRPSVRED